MQTLLRSLDWLNKRVIWGPPMIVLMLGTGLVLTVATKGAVFRHFGTVMAGTFGSLFKKRSPTQVGAVSPFQAMCTALAATAGTGNIVGVALAIAVGGPGALFWMWVSALLGMVVKCGEVTLAVAYRTTDRRGQPVGGPMYYIANGLNAPRAARLFALCGAMAAFGIGAMVQANSLTSGLQTAITVPSGWVGLFTALLAGLVLMGGIRRIASIAEILVPFMALFYTIGAGIVLAVNREAIPAAFGAIFRGAFGGTAAIGGFAGAGVVHTCRVGIARGVFTHEAGMGSAPIAHATAHTDHPVRQGLWGAAEVFVDSIVMCTVTGLVILTTGVWQLPSAGDGGAVCAIAFEQAFSGGRYVVAVALVLFAFATVIAWYYYGERCVDYLFGGRPAATRLYQTLYIACVYGGCVTAPEVAWTAADLFNGLMALPNLVALIALSPVVGRLSDSFFRDGQG